MNFDQEQVARQFMARMLSDQSELVEQGLRGTTLAGTVPMTIEVGESIKIYLVFVLC